MHVLAALIEAGADVNCQDQDGYQPLHYLLESHDKPEVIRLLAEKRAEVNSLPNSRQLTPIYLACKNNFVGDLEILISLGALEGKSRSLQRERAFEAAITFSYPKLSEDLPRRGTDPNAYRYGFIETSSRNLVANKRILQLLLEHTDLIAKDHSGQTLLSHLFHWQEMSEEEALELARLFLESLPEHKMLEACLLKSMMQSQYPKSCRRRTLPIVAENQGWQALK